MPALTCESPRLAAQRQFSCLSVSPLLAYDSQQEAWAPSWEGAA